MSHFRIRSCWVLYAMLLHVLGGCMRPRPWRYVQEDAPWIGPGNQAWTRYRHIDPPLFIAAAGGDEYRWEDAKGEGEDQAACIERATRFFVESGGTSDWEERRNQYGSNVVQSEKIPPFHFTVVSFRPTVVLMRPLDAGGKAGRPFHNGRAGYHKFWPSTFHWSGDIEYGTSLPYSSRLQWFSPDLYQKPTPVELTSPRTAIIPIGSGELQLIGDDGEWHVIRK